MVRDGTLSGLWIVRTNDTPARPGPVLARVQNQLFVLAFTNAPRAQACARALGTDGTPFYVCRANLDGVIGELRASGARGCIVDYDPARATFRAALALPQKVTPTDAMVR
jgi:hypothetical protein